MSEVNKVILIGNLTRDPETRSVPSGVTCCSFGLAVNRRFNNAQGQRETDFFLTLLHGVSWAICV